MEFEYWWVFFLVPIVLLPWRKKKSRALYPSFFHVSQDTTWRMRLSWVPHLLASMGLFLLIVALARPITTKQFQTRIEEGLDMVLVVDTSGSMIEEDYTWEGQKVSRMEVARQTLKLFVQDRPFDRIGLVVFGEEAFTQAPLTMDKKGIIPFVDQIQIGLAGESATAIGDGIAIAAQRLKNLSAKSKIMIVLTDGQSNMGSDPIQMAKACSELGITIYTIGIGGGRSGLAGMMGLSSGVDQKMLLQISEETGGEFFYAQTGVELKKVYDEINSLEPSPAEVEVYNLREERFHLFACVGIFFLLTEWLLSQTLLRRFP